MIAQGINSLWDFLTERNSSDYFRGKKILWWIKDQARAHVSGEKSELEPGFPRTELRWTQIALGGLHEAMQEFQLEETTDRRPLDEDRKDHDRVGHVDDRRLLG